MASTFKRGKSALAKSNGWNKRSIVLMIPSLSVVLLLFATIGIYTITASRAATGLAWAPPKLSGPTVLNITPTKMEFKFTGAAATKDYILKLPATPFNLPNTRRIDINGGRNVVLIGGEIRAGVRDQPVIKFYGQTGTVHIEGLKVSGTPQLGEGLQFVNMPNATVQIENVRFDTLNGNCGDAVHHCDFIQIYNGGPKYMRIDRLTGATDYQAFMLQHGPTSANWGDFRNIDIRHTKKQSYLVFDLRPQASQIKMTNVNLYGGNEVYSLRSSKSPKAGLSLSAPKSPNVPAGVAGVTYRTPGYQ